MCKHALAVRQLLLLPENLSTELLLIRSSFWPYLYFLPFFSLRKLQTYLISTFPFRLEGPLAARLNYQIEKINLTDM